jgi:hypothetical protein
MDYCGKVAKKSNGDHGNAKANSRMNVANNCFHELVNR